MGRVLKQADEEGPQEASEEHQENGQHWKTRSSDETSRTTVWALPTGERDEVGGHSGLGSMEAGCGDEREGTGGVGRSPSRYQWKENCHTAP